MQYMTPRQIQLLLETYYDIPQKIKDELREIKELEEEQRSVCLPAMQLSGMPGGKGSPGDPTAKLAIQIGTLDYDNSIRRCLQRIAQLRENKNWCWVTLETLRHTDRRLIELAYMGPSNPQQRQEWDGRRPAWKQIAYAMNYDEDWTRKRAQKLLKLLSDLSRTEEAMDAQR